MVFVADRRGDAVLGAQVAHEDRDDQGVGFVAGHLDEAGGAEAVALVVLEVAEELHLEEATRLRAGAPGPAAAPGARGRQGFELLVDAFEPMLGQAIQPVVQNPRHLAIKPTGQGGGRGAIRGAVRPARITSSCQGGAWTLTASRSLPAETRKSPRWAVSRKVL